MGNLRAHLKQFLRQFLRQVGDATKPEKIIGLIVFLVQLGMRGLPHGILEIGTSALLSAVWTFCLFGIWLAWKAGKALHSEEMARYDQYKPLIHYRGSPPLRKRPSRWGASIGPVILSLLLCAVLVFSIKYGQPEISEVKTLKVPAPPDLRTQVLVPTILSDPVIHIEPEHGMIHSNAGGQTISVFDLRLVNTGLEDIAAPDVVQDYFIAERGPEIVIKDLGGTPVLNHIPALKRKQAAQLRLDFREHVPIMHEIASNFNGPTLSGVRIRVRFRREADGKEFEITRTYAVFGPIPYGPTKKPQVPVIYTSDADIDRTRSLRLSDVIPYFDRSGQWVPVTHERSQDKDGRLVHRYY